jgi:hypothetical protein
VLVRLTDRRIAVEKELSALGESKKGATDIFRHCRGFERAYSVMLQVRLWQPGGSCGCPCLALLRSAVAAFCAGWLQIPFSCPAWQP